MKIAIVTPILAHYRRSLFLHLDTSRDIRFTHLSTHESASQIQAMDPSELREFRRLKNFEFGPLLWQQGVLSGVLNKDIRGYIFTGNAKYLSTWVAAGVARLLGKRVYFWTIGWHRPERGVKRLVRLGFYKIANRLMVYGDPEKRKAVAHGYPEDRIDVIYNSVIDPSDVNMNSITCEQEELAVGAVVRLNPVKKLGLLIEAVSLLNEAGKKVKVILGGDGPERQVLEERAEELEVDCEFLGAIHTRDEIEGFYRRVMISVLPSAAGLTVIQSLAYGVPVITDDHDETQMPEATAIIPGITGSRFAAGSAQTLASEISRWLDTLTNDPSPTAEACRREVELRWSPDVQAERMLKALRSGGDRE